jgi:hypothetical protein|tara:strand:- start:433 stop:720 length:288 start_codon:yes stop_codon:yes gene_type:complete
VKSELSSLTLTIHSLTDPLGSLEFIIAYPFKSSKLSIQKKLSFVNTSPGELEDPAAGKSWVGDISYRAGAGGIVIEITQCLYTSDFNLLLDKLAL